MGGRSKKRRNSKDKDTTLLSKAVLSVIALILTFLIYSLIVGIIALFKVGSSSMPRAVTPGSNEPVNILLLGMDIGDPEQVNNNDIKRTDTMMVVNYNPKSKELKMVSIPRDTLITVNNKNYKINAAYALGGYEKVKSEVQNLLDIRINYIVRVDYNAFNEVVDAIGGVKMEIERNMIYDDDAQNLHINFKAGETVKLDGQKAQEFFRWRKNNDGSGFANGDLDRIQNQQKLISKLIEKCKSPMIIFRMPKILNAIANNVETNMPAGKIIKYGLKCLFVSSDNRISKVAAGTPKTIGGQSYLVFDKNSNKELISSLSSSASTISSSNIDKNIRIQVLNGTKITGLAGELKKALGILGYNNVDTGNTEITEKSVIMSNDKELLKALKSDCGIKKTDKKEEKESNKQYDVVIILGTDFKEFGE